jgi:Flp pilus assembly protein TadD
MGRRHRNRHAGNGGGDANGPMDAGNAREETLAPTYVSVREKLWNAESDAPVLALDGLRPWEEIRGPALLLEENGATLPDGYIADSQDPQQLDLTQAERIAMKAQIVTPVLEEESVPIEPTAEETASVERPVLVLEPDPPVEVQAELPLLVEPVADASPEAMTDGEPEPAEAALEPEAPPPVDPVELLYQEARAAAAEGRVSDARALYGRVLVERPAHTGSRNNLALLLESAGDQQGALAQYDRALDTDGENGTLLTNRGALLGAMGRYAAAERDLKKVLRADPSHPEALFNLGVVMTKKGLWAEAVPQLRRAVELDPARGAAYFYLGEALNHVDDLYGAMASYQRASELMPEHPRALYGLGIVYDRLGRPDDAARMYRRSREVGRR